MKVERFLVKTCCGNSSISFKTTPPLSKDFLPLFVNAGFTELQNYTKAGLLYMESGSLIINGAFGDDKLHVKCKTGNCTDIINDLEQLLNNF